MAPVEKDDPACRTEYGQRANQSREGRLSQCFAEFRSKSRIEGLHLIIRLYR
jgi:hypothetical protein